MTIEIEYRDGRPWGFLAKADELEGAVAAIDDDLLVTAYEDEWRRRGLAPPALTVFQLRERILEIHQRQADRQPRERTLSISQAAPRFPSYRMTAAPLGI